MPPASAIPNTCPTTGPDAATVNIDEPAAGATVAGQVTVRGRASAPTGLTKVELFVGETLRDFQTFSPSRPDVEFVLRFDVAGVQADPATISVVACGGAPGSAVRGIASVQAQVDRSSVASLAPVPLAPVDESGDRAGAGTGPLWVGAVFGLAGLAGLVVASRLRGAREASAPSPDAGRTAARRPGRPGRR
ncbi:MAG TPA: Ig-like domain-containing protein, partial [Acidimicrobiales bacterium]|nr:Ig-like domain-containing protein [Acidimicrobiales bacterium]